LKCIKKAQLSLCFFYFLASRAEALSQVIRNVNDHPLVPMLAPPVKQCRF
jgi:hypothetical protein